MDNKPLQIITALQGTLAQIRIIGIIGWDVDSETFRAQIDRMIQEGATSAHIYLNTPGGSCFDAAEIVNILSAFKGNVTGEGGAIVASAGTYIAENCKTFEMPDNGQFMIHRPSGGVSGTLDDIEAYVPLMRNTDTHYYNTYKAIAKNPSLFEEKWKKGDWWMTAKEAKEHGFITGVKPKIKIDRETAAMITACGSPITISNEYQPITNEEMDLKIMAVSLGLPETATEEEIKARIAVGNQAIKDLANLKTEQERKTKEERASKIKDLLDKAIIDKRIKADTRDTWEKMLTDDFDNASKVLTSIHPIEKPTLQIIPGADGKGKLYKGKTFAQLQDEDPELLAELEENDPEGFAELFAEHQKSLTK